jgi:hypothetical protein
LTEQAQFYGDDLDAELADNKETGCRQDALRNTFGVDDEIEEGWVDVFVGDNYVGIYGSLFDFANGPRAVALFGPIDYIRMLITGFCTAVLVSDSEAANQAYAIFGIHAIQFAMQLFFPPEPQMSDRVLDTIANLTDLLPLLISVLPHSLVTINPCNGALPVGVQMLLMASALFDTAQRIIILGTYTVPAVFGLTWAVMMTTYKFIKWKLAVAARDASDAVHDAEDGIADAVHDAEDGIADAVHDAEEGIADAVHDAEDGIADAVHDAEDDITDAMTASENAVQDIGHVGYTVEYAHI